MAGRSGRNDTSSLEPLLSELALVRRVLDGDPKFARFFADPSIDGMMAGKTLVVPGVSNKLTTMAPRFMPRHAMAKIVRAVQERRKRS